MPTSVDPSSQPRARRKTPSAVLRLAGGNLSLLPNVVCETVQHRDGPDPGSALFRYVADQYSVIGFPARIEQLFPIDTTGPYTVQQDDRLCVVVLDPWGNLRYLFDGFAQVPQANLSPKTEQVTFQALGVAVRAFDTPFLGAVYRDADKPDKTDTFKDTGLPVRFNPNGLGNATYSTANDYEITVGGFKTPLFLDTQAAQKQYVGQKWSLSMAARYVIGFGNPDEEYVQNPTWSFVNQLLDAYEPADGKTIDPTDSTTFNAKPIYLRDRVITGKTWPDALSELISPHGFAVKFELSADANGMPQTRLILWKRDNGDKKRYKALKLPAVGSGALEPASANLGDIDLNRDLSGVANEIVVESAPKRYEVSVVLAPGFPVDPTDATYTNRKNFRKAGNPNFTQYADKYRKFIFAETGQQYWDGTNYVTPTDGTDLTAVLGGKEQDKTLWTKRNRPGVNTLLSQDSNKQYLKARLAISFDYSGPKPGVWNGTGTWFPIKGDWALLKDQLGVRLGCQDPNAMDLGAPTGAMGTNATRAARLVEWLAGTTRVNFSLRLTTVIEGDQRIQATAAKRPASPTEFTITQVVDARDRFKYDVVSSCSEFNDPIVSDGEDLVVRDDTADATAEATARQAAQEIPHLAGTATVPRLTLAYSIGDRITGIFGRDLSLQANATAGTKEQPVYPEVVGVTYTLSGDQSTSLVLSDRRADVKHLA